MNTNWTSSKKNRPPFDKLVFVEMKESDNISGIGYVVRLASLESINAHGQHWIIHNP